jgi:type III pantothenate kinase
VPQPERIGADRLCAAAGVVDAATPNAVVVDIGTAITVDRVRDLEFVGGAILPGPGTMLRAMGTFARQLPKVDLDDVETLFPTAGAPTEKAMALGAGVATLGGIKEAVSRLSVDDRGVAVWVTGGASERYRGHLPDPWNLDVDLAARGLARITRRALSDAA